MEVLEVLVETSSSNPRSWNFGSLGGGRDRWDGERAMPANAWLDAMMYVRRIVQYVGQYKK